MTITSTQLYNEVLEAMDNFQVILIRASSKLSLAPYIEWKQDNNSGNYVILLGDLVIMPDSNDSTSLYVPINFEAEIVNEVS